MKFKIFTGLFLFLYFVVLPFPYWTFNLGKGWLYPAFAVPLEKLAQILQLSYNPQFLSDGILQYLSIGIILLISGLLTLLFYQLKSLPLAPEKLLGFLYKINLLILSFFMMKYGLDKIVGGQFDIVEGNLLHKELKDFSKDLLLWSTLQSSALFNYTTGAVELLGGLFLLNPYTRKLGIVLSFLSMSFVVLLNFSFDINVKILALYLFTQSVFASLPYLRNFKNVLFPKAEIVFLYQEKSPHKINKWWVSLLLVFAISEGIIQHLSSTETPKNWAKSYQVLDAPQHFIHFHSDAFFIEEKDGEFRSRPFQIIQESATSFHYQVGGEKQSILQTENQLFWISSQDTLPLSLQDFSSSPYLQDDFNWFTESSLEIE